MENVEIKKERFDGKSICIGEGVVVDLKALQELVVREKAAVKNALWVHVHESVLAKYFDLLVQMGFKFHHHRISKYVFYCWNNADVEDKVPEYATSIGGAGAIILSPDETQVLLVWEYGKWKHVSGAVSSGENALETCLREVTEEVGIQHDPKFEPKLVGGWNIKNARYGRINDTFWCFAIKAKSTDCNGKVTIKVDGFEIKNAAWFNISDLLAIDETAAVKKDVNDTESAQRLSSVAVPFRDTVVSYTALKWLRNYKQGKFFSIDIDRDVHLF